MPFLGGFAVLCCEKTWPSNVLKIRENNRVYENREG